VGAARVASGGELEVQSGGTLDIQSGASTDFSGGVDLDGALLDLDANGNTSFQADTDDQIDVEIAGADDFQFTANDFVALSGSGFSTDSINETTGAAGVTIDSAVIQDGGLLAVGSGLIDTAGITDGLVLDSDGDTTLSAPTDDQIDIEVSGADDFTIAANKFDFLSGSELEISTGATVDVDGVMTNAEDLEHILFPSIMTESIITTTDGAVWTVGASDHWYIDRLFCNVTTNFDCTGDDCTMNFGLSGGDVDGFLDLDDAELQTSDAEVTGLAAGWQGFGSTDTRGAFFAAGGGVVMTNDTIDVVIEDASDNSNPTAGAATCYLVYTRLD